MYVRTYVRACVCGCAGLCMCFMCVYQCQRWTRLPCVLQLQVRKSELEKRKNDDEQEEGWVACDACGAWVHMICGMFNKGRNDDDMNYHCPKCLITGVFVALLYVTSAIAVTTQLSNVHG